MSWKRVTVIIDPSSQAPTFNISDELYRTGLQVSAEYWIKSCEANPFRGRYPFTLRMESIPLRTSDPVFMDYFRAGPSFLGLK